MNIIHKKSKHEEKITEHDIKRYISHGVTFVPQDQDQAERLKFVLRDRRYHNKNCLNIARQQDARSR